MVLCRSMVLLELVAIPPLSAAFLRVGDRASFTREGAARWMNVAVFERANSGSEAPQSSEWELKEVELWLDEVGVDRRCGGSGPPVVRLKRYPGRGIGLAAVVELERDSTVASIPRKVCLSSEAADAPAGTLRAWAHSLFASISFYPTAACSEEQWRLERDVAVVTLQVFLECAAGARSTHAPWMAMLMLNREGDLNLPALWPTSDLENLKGSLVLQEVGECLARAEAERNAVAEALAKEFRGKVAPGWAQGETTDACPWFDVEEMEGRPTYAEWLHARCTVQSRAYRVGGRYLLIPLVDFANHSDDVAYAVCPGDGVFTGSDEVVLVADRSYRPGHEVCTSYGDMDNAKRLFSFGFVTLTQPGEWSQHSSTAATLPLPTEAFCDVALNIAPTDVLRVWKEGVLREQCKQAEDCGLSRNLSARFPLTPCDQFVSQLVEGPAQSFLESVLPVLRLVALTPEQFTSLQDFGHLLTTKSALETGFEIGVVGQLEAHRILATGRGSQVLELLRNRWSVENEREAVRLLAEQCSTQLESINLTSSDVKALREEVDELHEFETFAACGPRSLLSATVRVGEAIAWYALLEACADRIEGCAGVREEQTWASYILERWGS